MLDVEFPIYVLYNIAHCYHVTIRLMRLLKYEALAKFVEHERGVRVAPGLDENNSSLIERTTTKDS